MSPVETRPLERVLLVGAYLRAADPARSEESFAELERLTETAGGLVVDRIVQRLERYHPGTLLGSGKIEEIARAVRAARARTVIVDRDLSPAQQKTLERELDAKIIDRTRLILDIFARRARTREGELQVELAQLSYMLPRLTGSWRGFSQQVGGIGTRGPGERKLEYERRHIQLRISHLKNDIERVRRQRAVQRRRRLSIPVPSVAIIGYTNVGKSSLLNALIRMSDSAREERTKAAGAARPSNRALVYADDKLFATLDPTTRRVRLPQGGWAVFTDTVGFISNLPTALVAAFRSTLEEVLEADCVLILEDASSPEAQAQRATVEGVLRELGADGIPRLAAANKSDVLDAGRRAALEREDRLLVSAKTGAGLEALLEGVQGVLNHRWLLREAVVEPDGALIDFLHRSAQVLELRPEGGRLNARLRVTRENWSRILHRLGNPAPGTPPGIPE
ncbi:MAG: GTPase HflX [Elusimicrobiota bacterium]|jgi:GTP-binding protein HflX